MASVVASQDPEIVDAQGQTTLHGDGISESRISDRVAANNVTSTGQPDRNLSLSNHCAPDFPSVENTLSEASPSLQCQLTDDLVGGLRSRDETTIEAEHDVQSSAESDCAPQDEEDNQVDKLTARRVTDQDEFGHWMRQKQKQMIQKSLRQSAEESVESVTRSETGVQRTMAGIHRADKKIISSPREYQVELFERAKEKNLIVVLPTGTGKTLIAALLLRHVIEQELTDRASNEESLGHRISFFLVDKISLVYQQWKVLKANIAHNVAKFHGDLIGTASTHQFWKQQFEENMVIVCTAEILKQCLSHGYFRMDQINLLVFDEAHHAKKNHPYARIIKDFYVELENGDCRRPRILGMTASPVDANTDLPTAATQLEGLLHAEIATVDDPALMRTVSSRDGSALDRVTEYWLPEANFETALWHKLNRLIGHNHVFRKIFIFTRTCGRELGRWCADRVWQLCLTPAELTRAKAKTEMSLNKSQSERVVASIDAQTGLIEDAREVLLTHQFSDLTPTDDQVSQKILALLEILGQYFKPAFDKCIIFVERRWTAVLLADTLNQAGFSLNGITAGTLVSA